MTSPVRKHAALFVVFVVLTFAAMMLLEGDGRGRRAGQSAGAPRAHAALALPAPVRTLFVAPEGRDAGSGTAADPLRSLQKAADLATAGTLVSVRPGEYRPVVSRVSGVASRRITFLSEDRWHASIVTSGTTAPWANEGSYVDIIGFRVTAPNAAQGIISRGSSVRIVGNRVVSVALRTSRGAGAGINHASYTTQDNEVIDNHVTDIGPAGNLQVHGIYVSQTGATVRRNVVTRVSGWCLHAWHAATRISVVENTVAECGTPGVGGGGIVAGAGDSPGGVTLTDSTIARNVVRDSVRGIRLGGRTGANVQVRDNRVLNDDQ